MAAAEKEEQDRAAAKTAAAAAGGGGGGGGGGGDERAPSVLPHLEHAASAFEGPSTRTYRVLFFAACTFWS